MWKNKNLGHTLTTDRLAFVGVFTLDLRIECKSCASFSLIHSTVSKKLCPCPLIEYSFVDSKDNWIT